MKENFTEIVFILDRSGSMGTLVNDTIGGFNAFIEKQKVEPGEAVLTTVLFDHEYKLLHDCVNIHDVNPMTYADYVPRGMTALYDAIGKTINDIGEKLSSTPEHERPSSVVFVITTDGYENASKKFTQQQIKDMIEHQTDKYNWQFLFLGANIEVDEVAGDIGIELSNAATFTATADGMSATMDSINCAVSSVRSRGFVDANWSSALSARHYED